MAAAANAASGRSVRRNATRAPAARAASAVRSRNSGHILHLSLWLSPLLIALVLWLALAILRIRRVRAIYEAHFPETPRERLFLASLGFFVAVAVVRALTWAIHAHLGPFYDISMRGRHIHHLVWGILILLAVGYGWLIEVGTGFKGTHTLLGRCMALAYGVGSALTLDEFALWLNLRDVYWEREGHESVEAILLFGAVLSLGIFGAPFLKGIGRETLRILRR